MLNFCAAKIEKKNEKKYFVKNKRKKNLISIFEKKFEQIFSSEL
jgi:hypothetical protein